MCIVFREDLSLPEQDVNACHRPTCCRAAALKTVINMDFLNKVSTITAHTEHPQERTRDLDLYLLMT